MNRGQSLYRLQFYNNILFNQDINAIPNLQQFLPVVDHWKRNLKPELQPVFRQFVREASFVGTFKQPRAELSMDLERSSKDRVGTGDRAYPSASQR